MGAGRADRRCPMTWWSRLLHRNRLERDLDRELRDHLERHVADLVKGGMSEAEARRKASLTFGGVERVKEIVVTRGGLAGSTTSFRTSATACECS